MYYYNYPWCDNEYYYDDMELIINSYNSDLDCYDYDDRFRDMYAYTSAVAPLLLGPVPRGLGGAATTLGARMMPFNVPARGTAALPGLAPVAPLQSTLASSQALRANQLFNKSKAMRYALYGPSSFGLGQWGGLEVRS